MQDDEEEEKDSEWWTEQTQTGITSSDNFLVLLSAAFLCDQVSWRFLKGVVWCGVALIGVVWRMCGGAFDG